MSIKEFIAKRVLDMADKHVGTLLESRKVVRTANGEAKEERKKGKQAPSTKRPWLVWRGAVRTVTAMLVGILGYFLADKVPAFADPEFQKILTDGIPAIAVLWFSSGAASDWLRLSPGRGVPSGD